MQNSRLIASPDGDPAPRTRRPSVCPQAGGPQAGRRQGLPLFVEPLCLAVPGAPAPPAPRRATAGAWSRDCGTDTGPTCGPSPGHGGAALPLGAPLPVWGALPRGGRPASCRPGGRVTHFPRGALPRIAGGRAAEEFTGSSPRGGLRRPASGEDAEAGADGGGGRDRRALSAGNGLENAFRRLIPPSPRAWT